MQNRKIKVRNIHCMYIYTPFKFINVYIMDTPADDGKGACGSNN